MKIPLSNLSFSLLNEDIDISAFRCGEPDLTEFLIEDALENQAARLSVTRIVLHEGQVVGFFTLTNDCIIRKSVSDDDGEEWYPYPHYPALKIARLATHQEFEGRGIGRAMLLKTVAIAMRLSQYVGCRMITVDAKPKSEGFYLKYGFQKALINKKKDTIPLYRDFYRSYQEAEKGMSPPLTVFDERSR
ncbi:GNAT family N-acetyltransferase [Methanoculleus sp.]|uniref:GNAT family N-acetyltransferase n=1 Tax=Methanoculleus sp. TaxID=90427 RepID=UPI0025EF5D06|nr:GNAT family N-acetyltransferase [Methanoculleus sp.]